MFAVQKKQYTVHKAERTRWSKVAIAGYTALSEGGQTTARGGDETPSIKIKTQRSRKSAFQHEDLPFTSVCAFFFCTQTTFSFPFSPPADTAGPKDWGSKAKGC